VARRTANEKLQDSKDMPKVVIATEDRAIGHLGGSRLLIAPPLAYDAVMMTIPYGQVTTSEHIRSLLAKQHDADSTCQLTAGIFINIVAEASDEREEDRTPYWRTLRKGGELNPRFPGGLERQRAMLEAEGHKVVQKGKRYFVEGYEEKLAKL
jgi:alkylated DNA nucleotide flippase Atl1